MKEIKKQGLLDNWMIHGIEIPFVDREPELAELEQLLEQTINQLKPHSVTVLGNQGIGKTRFVSEFIKKARKSYPSIRVYRGVCRKDDRGKSYGVIGRILRARFGIVEGTDENIIREKIRDQVTELLQDKRVTEFLQFLGGYMNIKFPDSPFLRTIEEHPEHFHNISKTILKRFFELDGSNNPVILTFEDIQWADEESLDLIHYLINEMEDGAVLIICVATPHLNVIRPNWFEGTKNKRHFKIELGPLTRDASELLVTKLLQKAEDIPDELVDTACDMAGGNPLLLEQMIRVFIENNVIEITDDNKWIIHKENLDDIVLPLTVEEAVQARISALSPVERNILEKAACIGSVFWLNALVVLERMDKEPPELWSGFSEIRPHIKDVLTELVERDYILRIPDSSFPNDEEYAFKHNLEREAILNLVSPSLKKKYHKLIAFWLDYNIPNKDDEQLETIATHYESGGEPLTAAYFYINAGSFARNRFAYKKAIRYFEKGLELLQDHDLITKIDTLHDLGDCYQRIAQFDKALECFEEMRKLAWKLDFKSKGGAAHNRIGRLYREKGELDQAMRHLGTGLALFKLADDERGIASSMDDIGKVHWLRGEYELALKQLKEALKLRRKLGDKRSIALSLSNLGSVYQDSGYFKDALDAMNEALELRREIGDLPGVVISLNNLGTLYQDKGEQERAIEIWQEGLRVAKQIDDKIAEAYLLTNIGIAQYQLGWYDDAIKTLSKARELADQIGEKLVKAESSRALGKSYMYKGDFIKARTLLREALEIFQQIKSKVHLGVCLRSIGELTVAAGWGEELLKAKEYFEQAIDIFKEAGNELELARTYRAYSNLLKELGDERSATYYRTEAEKIFTKLKVASISDGYESTIREVSSPGISLSKIKDESKNSSDK